MSYLVLGGNGQQGRAIVRYLALHGNAVVNSADLNRPLDHVELPHVNYWTGDAYSLLEKKSFLKDKIVISCLRPELTPELAVICKANYAKGWIDMGGDDQSTDKIRKLNFCAGRKSMTVVTDCGLAPGIASTIAGKAVELGIKDVSIFCGGLPLNKEQYDYVLSFHPEGLLGEYVGTAKIIKEHKVVRIPTLIELRGAWHPTKNELRNLEYTYTSGGLSFTPDILSNKLRNLYYFTLRFKGHWKFLKENILWRDERDIIKVMSDIFPKVSPKNPDHILLGYEFDDHDPIWYRWDYDYENNISAMAQATGYIVGAVATMIHEGLLPYDLVSMHDIDLDEIISRVKRIPGQFKTPNAPLA